MSMNSQRTASFIKHVPCPKCGSRDNNSLWTDGHEYCFGCKRYVPPHKGIQLADRVAELKRGVEPKALMREAMVNAYPNDVQLAHGNQWLRDYGIVDSEITNNHIQWSPDRKWLVFPYYDGHKRILFWQARNFSENSRSKWLTFGPRGDVIKVFNWTKESGRAIIIVEDIVSAIKVGRSFTCIPLFGSQLSLRNMVRMKYYGNHFVFWLDRDKAKEAVELSASMAGLGVKTGVIITDNDPKVYSNAEIREIAHSVLPESDMNRPDSVDQTEFISPILM